MCIRDRDGAEPVPFRCRLAQNSRRAGRRLQSPGSHKRQHRQGNQACLSPADKPVPPGQADRRGPAGRHDRIGNRTGKRDPACLRPDRGEPEDLSESRVKASIMTVLKNSAGADESPLLRCLQRGNTLFQRRMGQSRARESVAARTGETQRGHRVIQGMRM